MKIGIKKVSFILFTIYICCASRLETKSHFAAVVRQLSVFPISPFFDRSLNYAFGQNTYEKCYKVKSKHINSYRGNLTPCEIYRNKPQMLHLGKYYQLRVFIGNSFQGECIISAKTHRNERSGHVRGVVHSLLHLEKTVYGWKRRTGDVEQRIQSLVTKLLVCLICQGGEALDPKKKHYI